MAKQHSRGRPKQAGPSSVLRVILDEKSKAYLSQAAELRRISISDYVRTVLVVQAQREVLAAREQTISLTPEEQLAFWHALNETPRLTEAQQGLSTIMRGES